MFGEHWEDRDCDKCVHNKAGGCTKWDCEYEPRESDLLSRSRLINAIEETTWYHINSEGKLVEGANGKDDVPLYKADDVFKAINEAKDTTIIKADQTLVIDYPDIDDIEVIRLMDEEGFTRVFVER